MTLLHSSFNGTFLRLHVGVTEMDPRPPFPSAIIGDVQVQGPAFRPGRRGWSCHFQAWAGRDPRSLLSLSRVTSLVLVGDKLGTQSEGFPLLPCAYSS